MTKEQEIIERLNRFKTIKVLYGNTFAMTTEQLRTLQEDIETALNIIKENSAEIKTLTQINKSYKGMIRKKDRQINYMANFINDNIPYTKDTKELENEEHLLTLSIIDTNKKYFDEIDKLSKVIDLMAEYIDSNNYVDNEECQFQWDFDIKKCIENSDCKDCIKQYFERKSKEC